MVEEIDKLKGLSPEERIKRLKELEQKRKKEIESAQKLIKQTEIEIEEKSKEKQQLPIPQLKSEDLASLTSKEEKEIFKIKRYESSSEKKETKNKEPKPDLRLEETIWQEKLPEEKRLEANVQYQQQLATQPIDQLKEKLEYLNQNSQSLSYDQKKEVSNINYALQKKMDDIESGKYRPDDYSTVKEVQESLSMAKKIENSYKR